MFFLTAKMFVTLINFLLINEELNSSEQLKTDKKQRYRIEQIIFPNLFSPEIFLKAGSDDHINMTKFALWKLTK